MSDEVPTAVAWHPWTTLARWFFGLLPVFAAAGPVLSAFRGLYAFRVACVFVVFVAVVFLLGRGRWRGPDVWLVLVALSFAVAGLVGLPRVQPGSVNSYSEFLAIMLGLSAALATRGWQRVVPGLYIALARGWVVAGLAACAAAAWEVATGIHFPGYTEATAPQPAATFGNPNALAIFVVMATVWAVVVHRAGGRAWRAQCWLLVVASVPVMYVTHARLAALAWLLVLAWRGWQMLRRSSNGLSNLVEAAVPAVGAFVAVVGALFLVRTVVEFGTSGTSGSVRESLTRQGLGLVAEHRGLPTWPGAFESLMLQHGDLDQTGGQINAHNLWLEILVQYGALTLVLLLTWLCACALAPSSSRADAAPAVVALLLLGCIDSSFLDASALWIFVVTLAVASRSELNGRTRDRPPVLTSAAA
jgi:hypothetical protein